MTKFEDVKNITIEEYFDGNQFSINTFRDKYSFTKQDGSKETPAEVWKRVADEIASMETSEELKEYWSNRWFDEMWNDWWRPGGSIIKGAGNTKKISMSNCFSAETEFITDKGLCRFSDFEHGAAVNVLTTYGGFKSAVVKKYGKQKLYKLVLHKKTHEKIIYTTANHSWRVVAKGGTIKDLTTIELLSGMCLPYVKRKFNKDKRYICPMGFIHGLVFGDGYFNKETNSCRLDLCGDSKHLIELFKGFNWNFREGNDRIRIYHLPNFMKKLPDSGVNEEYLLGFLSGWFAADGTISKNGNASISSANIDNLEWFRAVSQRVGIYTSNIRTQREKSPFDGNDNQKLYSLYIIRDCLFPDFFFKKKHIDNFRHYQQMPMYGEKKYNWSVVSIEETDIVDDVWCVEVPDTHEFVLADGVGTNNCTTTQIRGDSLEDIFSAAFRLAKDCAYRQGIGVDFTPLRPRNTTINNSAEISTGAVHWMKFFDNISNFIGQKGRIPALLLSLKVDHPDIEEFVKSKSDMHSIQNANISVQITDAFMEACEKDGDWKLEYTVDSTGEVLTKTLKARDLLRLISERACNFGEPGVQFIDTIQRDVNTSYVKDPNTGKPFVPVSSNACSLSGDTKMYCMWEGHPTYRTIKELAETNNGYHELYNPIARHFHMCHVYKSGSSSAMVELVLEPSGHDNESVRITCTDNHMFLTDFGIPGEAKDLLGKRIYNFSHGATLCFCANIPKHLEVIAVNKIDGEYDVYDFTMPDKVAHWPWGVANGVWTHNSEKLMYPDSTCVLASINMGNFSSKQAKYLKEIIVIGESITRFLDNAISYELAKNKYPIPEQEYVIRMLREIGVGITNMHAWLLKQDLPYDSDCAIDCVEEFVKQLSFICYKTSQDLGEEKGNFEAFMRTDFIKSPFIKRLMKSFPALKFNTMRNSMILSIAPTGSLSLTFSKPAMSTGIEPMPGFYYWKRSRTSGQWKWYFIVPLAVRLYLESKGINLTVGESTEDPDGKIGESVIELIKNNVNTELTKPAHLIDPLKKVELMGKVAKWIDSSISTTYNMDESATPEVVEKIYTQAWKEEIKSVAVYRDKSRQGVIEFEPPPVVESRFSDKMEILRPEKIEHRCAPKRPSKLPCDVHNVTVKGKKWTVIVGLLNDEPFEVFAGLNEEITIPAKLSHGFLVKRDGRYDLEIPFGDDVLQFKNVSKLFINDEQSSWTRLVSLNLRTGTHVQFVIEQLKKSSGSINDFSSAIARVLKKYERPIVKRLIKCPQCGAEELSYNGCTKCLKCGWERCE